MLVRYFMTTNVITFSPDQTCHDAFHSFRKHRIRRAPVLDKDRLVGIVSERDLYRVLPKTPWEASQDAGERVMDMPVGHIMTTPVHVLSPNDHIETAARLMLKYKIGGIPVVKEGHILGLITESDIFKAMWNILSHKTTCRILFIEKESDTKQFSNDYIGMCFVHHCRVHTFLSYPESEEGYMYYLCVQGGDIDNLIKDLWSHSCEVIIVERDGTT
jgi:acetoin utilization protein AcuB